MTLGQGVGEVPELPQHLIHTIPASPHGCAMLELKTPIDIYELPWWLRP